MQRKYLFPSLFLFIILGIIAFMAHFWYYFEQAGSLQNNKIVFIEKGSGLSRISQQLEKEGVIKNSLFFELHIRLRGKTHKVRAGEFEIKAKSSPLQVLNMLIEGPFVQHILTVPEGLTVAEIMKLVESAPLLKLEERPEVREGWLMPETYYYTWQDTSQKLLKRMQTAMKSALNRAWAGRSSEHFLQSPDEILILASIVEKETAKDEERARIAAVFLNRLKKGMKLQSDPTVIYGLKHELDKPLTELAKADLEIPSRYNTYLNIGLPPTPICNPGLASIKAVTNPVVTEDLYFVADGTGGHVFAKTYQEHSLNHQKWRKIKKRTVR